MKNTAHSFRFALAFWGAIALAGLSSAQMPGADMGLQLAQQWEQMATQYAQQTPNNEALGHLMQAVKQFDYQGYPQRQQKLKDIARTGWQDPDGSIGSFLDSIRPSLRAAYQAALAPSIQFPPPSAGLMAPQPNMHLLQGLVICMGAEARRAQSQGRIKEAAGMAAAAAKLNFKYTATNSPSAMHLTAHHNIIFICPPINDILRDSRTTPEIASELGSVLYALDENWRYPGDALSKEIEIGLQMMDQLMGDPAMREQVLQMAETQNPGSRAEVEAQLQNVDELKAQIKEFTDIIVENSNKPYYQRDKEALKQIAATLARAGVQADHILQISVLSDTARANLRLSMALAAIKSNRPQIAQKIIDPFTGEPIKVTGQRLWSVGPDEQNQGGTAQFSIDNGVTSSGDIIVPIGS